MAISNDITNNPLLIDKPLDWTSFDVVNYLRIRIKKHLQATKNLKVGHAGTLDPKATGLLLVCYGAATKTIDQLQAQEKEYIATIKLGVSTPSFDTETEELTESQKPINHINHNLIVSTLKLFEGEQLQTPPIYSAIKINGQRAYNYARKGEQIEPEAKKIFIKQIELTELNLPYITLQITCSKGTYIRSLANSLGIALNTNAYLAGLRRTKIGNYHVENAVRPENFLELFPANQN